jgi:hypothetical protein
MVQGRDPFLTPKFLKKHAKRTKALKNMLQLRVKVIKWYINKRCQHLQNELIFACKNENTMLEQIQGGLKGGRGYKR